MLAAYSGASFGQSIQAEHSYPPEHALQPHQIVYEGYPRVLRSTSENIRTPNHLSHGPSAFSKPRPPRPGPQTVRTIRLRERLDLHDEKDLFYEAIVIKKIKSKKEPGASRTSSKDVKETRQLYKKIPAAASSDDCKPEAAYYKYRSSAKQERCKKDWCKEHDPHVMWPDDVERSFQFWIRTILPMGKKKVTAEVFKYENEKDAEMNCKPPAICRKQCGRNELISMMIYLDTGQVRDRKRISSHIQVLRGHTKRGDDEIFMEDDGSSATHDECAVLYEKWGKLRWNPDTKRIEPDRKHQASDLRSNYQLSSRNSRYQSSNLSHSYPGIHYNGPPRFKEMQFCLYVTLKNEANDNPLHTYTIAQQRTGAKAWNIHDIPDLQLFFPPTRHLSDDQYQDQLFYCEASLRMRHDLTEKGYQVGPEMQVMLSCPPDYHNWRVRATGYSGEGTQLIKSEERICEWAQGPDGQVQIVLWASAIYWAQLLSDCKVAYEGKQQPGSEYLPKDIDLLVTADPSSRCDRVLERSSFVQEIFATRSTGEEARVALLLWRLRQATENESTGLWTWRKIERYPEGLQTGTEIIGPYQELPRSASMFSMRTECTKHGEHDVESFDFNDLNIPIPDSKQSDSALGSPRHSTAFQWNSFDEGAHPSQSETSSFDQRQGVQQPQPNPTFLDTEMDVDASTQPSSFSPEPSSARTSQTSADNTFTTQEASFPLEFEHNMELPTDWANLDFSFIPGLETPGRLIDRQNLSSARQNNRVSLATPLALRQDTSFPIDPALSAWATPASQGQTVEHESQDTPTAQSRPAIARALTYLPPVPQTHILKSSREDASSSPGQSTTPTPHQYRRQHGEQSSEAFETPSRLPERVEEHSPLQPYRPAPTAQMDGAKDSTQQTSSHEDTDDSNNASLANQGFHSNRSDHDPQFDDHDSSFVTAVSTPGASALESFDHQGSSFQTQASNDQYNHSFNSQGTEAVDEDWHEITRSQVTEVVDEDWHEITHPQHPQSHHQTIQHNTFNHALAQSRPQPPSRPYFHRKNSSIPASDDFEELCGDAAQLAHLSSFEVCDDGANLAQLAQIHSATLRDSFTHSQQTASNTSFHPSLSSYPNPNYRRDNSHAHAQNAHQAPSLTHPILPSQRSRSRYPSLSGLEALITAAVGVGAGVEDGPLSAPAFGTTGASSFHTEPDRVPLSASASVPASGPSSPRGSRAAAGTRHEDHELHGSRTLGQLSGWNMNMIRQFEGDGMALGRQTGMAGPSNSGGSYGADAEDRDVGVGAVLGEVGEGYEL